jgi:hypothetical protein
MLVVSDGGVVKGVVMERRVCRGLSVFCVFCWRELLSACRWLRMSLSATVTVRRDSFRTQRAGPPAAPSRAAWQRPNQTTLITNRPERRSAIGHGRDHLGAGEVNGYNFWGHAWGKRLERISSARVEFQIQHRPHNDGH